MRFNPCVLCGLFVGLASLAGYGQDTTSYIDFAAKLHASAICSDSNFDRLTGAIAGQKISEGFDFLKYCDNAVIIYVNHYPEKPADYLEKIHKDVAAILPGLSFTDFSFRVVLDSTISDSLSKFYDFVVSLTVNGKIYKQQSTYLLHDVEKNNDVGAETKIDQNRFFEVFNKVLTDEQSPYRLYVVDHDSANIADYSKFGIIALTKAQHKMLWSSGVYFSPVGEESYDNKLTSHGIDSAIAEYKRLGLLAHLSPAEISAARTRIATQTIGSLNQVLFSFPGTIYGFDTELDNVDTPYLQLLHEYAAISKGAFKPQHIEDHFAKPVNKKALLKFTLNGKTYSRYLMVNDDWVDPDFFALVDRAVAENKLKGKFYDLFTGDQGAMVIFLTPAQADYLRAHKLLRFGDEEIDE